MLSPHTFVALTRVRDEDEARNAARRPDALPDPDEPVVERVARSRARRSLLARLHVTPARHV